MEFLIDNWYWILLAIVVVCGGVIYVARFCAMSNEERHQQIMAWLLQAVILAEKEFGSGTGKLKLSAVYDKFCERFPWLVKVIPFSVFSQYVDDALREMRKILENNSAIAAVAQGGDTND